MSIASFESLGIKVRLHGRNKQRTSCPHCTKQDDSLEVRIQEGRWKCWRCSWEGELHEESEARPSIERKPDDPLEIERKRQRLRQIWEGSVPLDDSAAHAVCRYLQSRSLGDVLVRKPKCLRAHPLLDYWESGSRSGAYSAMVALMSDANGNPRTLHCTYLALGGHGKAPVTAPKKLKPLPVPGSARGGAIRLYEPTDGILGIAEGIESALSLSQLHNIPVWAASCANALGRARIPQNVHTLYIGVDVDASGKGEEAANELAGRLYAWRPDLIVHLVIPDGCGPRDLNDELCGRVVHG